MGGRAPGLRSEGSWLAAELMRAGLEPGVLDRCAGWVGLSPAQLRMPINIELKVGNN